MELVLQKILVRNLKKLEDSSFHRFIEKLSVWVVNKQYQNIPKDDLTGKDQGQVADLIIEYYNYAYGAELTLDVLENIDEKKVREELQKDLTEVDISGHGLGTTMFTDRVNFIDYYTLDLVKEITDVDPVLCDLRDQDLLTQKQFKDLMKKRTSEEKIEDLCDIVRSWEDTGKYAGYTALQKYNEEKLKDVKTGACRWGFHRSYFWGKVNFIDNHRPYLIREITNVDPFLYDLWDLLTPEEYNGVIKKRTSQEKMRELCDIITHWGVNRKYEAYKILEKHDQRLVKDLEAEDRRWLNPRPYLRDSSSFLERHQSVLLRMITDVEPILCDFRDQDLMTQEQYNDVMRKRTSQEMMRDLCYIIRHSEVNKKYKAYDILKKHAAELIKGLEEEDLMLDNPQSHVRDHFVDNHRYDLIHNIKAVTPVLDDLLSNNLLTEYEYKNLQVMITPEKKMRQLCDIFWHQSDTVKDQFYITLWRYNYTVINKLEKPDKIPRPAKSLSSSKSDTSTGISRGLVEDRGEYKELSDSATFLEKHRLDLISRVIMVGPILDDLWEQGLLEHKQYELLRREPSIRKKMTELLDIVSDWEDSSKRMFFQLLCTHNPSVIMDLERTNKRKTTGRTSYLLKPKSVSYIFDSETTRRIKKHSSTLQDVQIPVPYRPRKAQDHIRNLETVPLTERKHFVDEHCWDLIRRIIMVDPVIDDLWEQQLLTQEQYDVLMKLQTPQKKMIDLYDIVRFWTNLKKDQVYLALRQHNPAFIRVLEKSDQKLISGKANKGSHYLKLTLDLETGSSAGEHFVDKNKSGLINVLSTVDPVVEDLREEGLLTEEQYHNILLKETSREKMEEIYDITDSFDNVKKDKVYLALRTHNRSHIRVMERISSPSLSLSENSGEVLKSRAISEEDDQNDWVDPRSIGFTIICSICMEMYTNPVTLVCGHNFCQDCIEKTWKNQDSDDMCCPICRRRFTKRPELNKNLVLCQISEFCQSTKSDKKTHEHCT